MDGLNHNSGQNAGKEGHVPADLSLPDNLRELSLDLSALAREDASLANSAMLNRIASASWSTPTRLKFQGEPVVITRPQVARSSNHAMRLAAAVAILATGAAAFFALRSSPVTSNNPSVIAENNTKPTTQTLTPEQAQVESDLALLDDIWGTSDSSSSSVTSDLWASASQIQTNVSTDALEELFSTEESMQ